LTNIIGNGVAAIVVCAWEGQLDRAKLKNALENRGTRDLDEARLTETSTASLDYDEPASTQMQ